VRERQSVADVVLSGSGEGWKRRSAAVGSSRGRCNSVLRFVNRALGYLVEEQGRLVAAFGGSYYSRLRIALSHTGTLLFRLGFFFFFF
jgi:hypothetical protein